MPNVYGEETITYTNNSPDDLEYLWVQLDQNKRARDSKSPLIEADGAFPADLASSFVGKYMGEGFDGGWAGGVADINDLQATARSNEGGVAIG